MTTSLRPTWIFRLAIFAAFVAGFVLLFVLPLHFKGAAINDERVADFIEISRGLGEALIVAAILAAIVDPYAKFRLGKEIGREIARETAGEHLPLKLREALESIQDIKLYLVRMFIDVDLQNSFDNPGLLQWRMTIHYEVENASWNDHRFPHQVAISDSSAEKADGKVVEVACYWNGKQRYRMAQGDESMTRMSQKKDGVTYFVHENELPIKSSRRARIDKAEYYHTTERLVADSEIQVIQVALPTIGVTLTVRQPKDLTVNTSLEYVDGSSPECPTGEQKGLVWRWQSDRAYLTNEHIWIMFETDNAGIDREKRSDSKAKAAVAIATPPASNLDAGVFT